MPLPSLRSLLQEEQQYRHNSKDVWEPGTKCSCQDAYMVTANPAIREECSTGRCSHACPHDGTTLRLSCYGP
jgi:hypothetical protein